MFSERSVFTMFNRFRILLNNKISLNLKFFLFFKIKSANFPLFHELYASNISSIEPISVPFERLSKWALVHTKVS